MTTPLNIIPVETPRGYTLLGVGPVRDTLYDAVLDVSYLRAAAQRPPPSTCGRPPRSGTPGVGLRPSGKFQARTYLGTVSGDRALAMRVVKKMKKMLHVREG
jgi:hypothetical protein